MGNRYTVVRKLPWCDICLAFGMKPRLAYADARLQKGSRQGSWAFCCREHFDSHGCELGLGHGQRLVKR